MTLGAAVGTAIVASRIGRRAFLAVAPKPPTAQIARGIVRVALSPEEEPEFPWLAVGAGVALVAAGGAVWYLRRRA